MEAGSAAEGGRRFLLDCTDFDDDRDSQGNLQEWVPLVYPDANSAVPYVMIRLPLQPQRPPAPDQPWKKGDRVEVCFVSSFYKKCAAVCDAVACSVTVVVELSRVDWRRNQNGPHTPTVPEP